jgi:signal transduction histidine kinase/FixJ family two-component response regulator
MAADPAEIAEAPAPVDQHILCVDDDPDFLKSLEFFLPEQINQSGSTDFWYRFLFLDNPKEALGALRDLTSERETVAMVISDQKMPQMKGTEFLGEAKKIAPDSIRVLLTGHAGIESAITAINEHLLDKYVTKPIENEHDFTVSIRHLLQKFQMQHTIAKQAQIIQALYAFSNKLNSIEDFQKTLDCIISFTGEVVRGRSTSILLLEQDELRMVAAQGLWPEGICAVKIPASDPIGAQILQCRRARVSKAAETKAVEANPTEVSPAESSSSFPEIVRAGYGGSQDTSALYAGLVSGDQPLGLLYVTRRPDDPGFVETNVDTLTYIASSASIALHNQLNRVRLENAYGESRVHAAALGEANGRLQILDRLKTDFLSFISHELRTPLAIMSAVGLVDRSSSASEQEEALAIAQCGYDRLERFVARGLQYFDWLATKPVKNSGSADLIGVVRAVAGALPELDGPDVDLEISLPEGPCPVEMDETYVAEVVQVLLENALKFSPGCKKIHVAVATRPGAVTLTVVDGGCGFPPEFSREIFRPFTIIDTAHHGEGTALSLAKASAVVEAHGGCIRAESQGIGQGARFIVSFPPAVRCPQDAENDLAPQVAESRSRPNPVH